MLSAVYTLERMSLSHAFLLALIHCKSFHWWGSEKHRQVADSEIGKCKISITSILTALSRDSLILFLYMRHHVSWVSLLSKGVWKNRSDSGSLKYPFLLLSERKAKCLRFFLLFLPFLLFIIKLNVAPLPPSLVLETVARIKEWRDGVSKCLMDMKRHSCRTLGLGMEIVLFW